MKAIIISITIFLSIIAVVHADYYTGLVRWVSFDDVPSTNTSFADLINTGGSPAKLLQGDGNNANHSTAIRGTSIFLDDDGTGGTTPDDDWINMTTPALSTLANFTVGVWINPSNSDVDTAQGNILTIGSDAMNGYGTYSAYHNSTYLELRTQNDGTPGETSAGNGNFTNNNWYFVVISKNSTGAYLYLNGTKETHVLSIDNMKMAAVHLNTRWYSAGRSGYYDELFLYNRTLSDTEINNLYYGGAGLFYPTFSLNFDNLVCTSSSPSDSISPYATDDTTPTFTFDSPISVACRISDQNISYTSMDSSRDCDYGQYLESHTCTLTSQDALVDYNTSIYINCINEAVNISTKLSMIITSLETPNSTEAIQQGIENSIVWPGATVYTNQKVYLRSLNNSQKLATVDKVVVYGNQRWLINYENTTALGLFNLTPVVYSLDMKNMSIKAIRANVTAFINSTKN